MGKVVKSRYFWAVCYPENMLDNWQEEIDYVLQVPYAYCIHDKDIDTKSDSRKDHVHILVAFKNTTTITHANRVFEKLSKPGCKCMPGTGCEDVIDVRYAFDYLIHDTEKARKANKYQYPKECRIMGNNFDIGLFEQLSAKDRQEIAREIALLIRDNCITNFMQLYFSILESEKYDSRYEEVLRNQSGFFERLTKGCYQNMQFLKANGRRAKISSDNKKLELPKN